MPTPQRSKRLLVSLALAVVGCQPAGSQDGADTKRTATPPARTQAFVDYWHQGKAEITRYALTQARYGELREGEAVMIFVTEDFLTEKQVKLESEPAGREATPILKLNLTKSFTTGIYPYSMMTSVFTPVDLTAHPHALKVTTSAQEWCGQTYLQINRRGASYRLLGHSYFEKEGDEDRTLDTAFLEDEIWTRIRLAPESLPIGTIRIIPGTMTARLRHRPSQVETARASFHIDSSRSTVRDYTIDYDDGERTLNILFEVAFPHRIIEWTETYMDGFGPSAKRLTTRAIRTNSMMIDYWNRNASADTILRRELGVEE